LEGLRTVSEGFLRAVQIHAHGGIDQLRYETAADHAITSEQDVIVKLRPAQQRLTEGKHLGKHFCATMRPLTGFKAVDH
jgi:hypothetical protein